MAGISSKAAGKLENKRKFNGIEHTTELDLNTYDAFFRNADPQIGRWWQIDPKPNVFESPYVMMGNNPIGNHDYLGDTPRVVAPIIIPQKSMPNVYQNHLNYLKKKLVYYSDIPNGDMDWLAEEGIPFIIENIEINGNGLISFKCIGSHGLPPYEYVELSLTYTDSNIFQVYSLGNGLFDSDEYVFNVLNIGYTGNTFANNVTGLFKRVINPDNSNSTRYSMPYFVHPNPEAMLSFIPSCVGSGEKYPTINSHEFLVQRLKEIGLLKTK
jgi:RHS repeat-associated protein